jgi:hypothetical protein
MVVKSIHTHLGGKLLGFDQFLHPVEGERVSWNRVREVGRWRTFRYSFSSDSRASSASISSSAFSGLLVMAHRLMPERWVSRGCTCEELGLVVWFEVDVVRSTNEAIAIADIEIVSGRSRARQHKTACLFGTVSKPIHHPGL